MAPSTPSKTLFRNASCSSVLCPRVLFRSCQRPWGQPQWAASLFHSTTGELPGGRQTQASTSPRVKRNPKERQAINSRTTNCMHEFCLRSCVSHSEYVTRAPLLVSLKAGKGRGPHKSAALRNVRVCFLVACQESYDNKTKVTVLYWVPAFARHSNRHFIISKPYKNPAKWTYLAQFTYEETEVLRV